MKKTLATASLISMLLLSACGSSNALSGKWELDEEESGTWCAKAFSYEESNYDRTTVRDTTTSGTYEETENGDYKFTDDDGKTTRYEISQEDNVMTMVDKEDERTCKYVPAS
ncbi:hypothetical protein ACU3L3_14340 [Priestia endophytica]|uniref:Lipoprotein n=1 Tax=Priestia endophytica DSM 13796 TaxID=1121089 RepID=A0A1I6C032_9BACI|nr:hypothetical protein [Priestia endophytica]KYG33465.1 hypothetical protein AZF06_21715 [Priestia endophytica]SFQ86519.1 hypothetical protein SAMN02745910_04659 [Priestia endophytica DSM 13796]